MPLPPIIAKDWQDLLASHLPTNRFVTLATRGRDGWPKARLLVLRGFDADRELLWFSTNAASEKMRELEEDPRAQIVAWDQERRIQWRIDCRMRVLAADEVAPRFPKLTETPAAGTTREELWERHDENSAITFHWPNPGVAITDSVRAQYTAALENYRKNRAEVPDQFVVLEGVVRAVDRLELTHPFHLRTRYRARADWAEEELTS